MTTTTTAEMEEAARNVQTFIKEARKRQLEALEELNPEASDDDLKVILDRATKGEGPKDIRDTLDRIRDEVYAETLAESEKRRFQEAWDEALVDAQTIAWSVIEAEDPTALIEPELRRLGYGGDIKPALLAYLAATTRLLPKEAMLCHLVFIAPPSVGKSYTVKIVFRLLPDSSWHEIEAGSPRALIYDKAPLAHRILFFSEADSIPTGEEGGPVSSAIRNMLQENHLAYDVVQQNPKTKDWETRHIEKDGPTVMFTTTTRSLGDQLMSRMFVVDMPDSQEQLRASLAAQADHELHGSTEPNEALISYQLLLQAGAPWDVVVPFAEWLASHLGRYSNASRVNRDFSRLLSLVKAAAILRHLHRETNEDGRLEATIEDYRLVYDLLKDHYETGVTGLSDAIRQVVDAVTRLRLDGAGKVGIPQLAKELPTMQDRAIRRHVRAALAHGWLEDHSPAKTRFDLTIGAPLPESSSLPKPEWYGIDPEYVDEIIHREAAPRRPPQTEQEHEEILHELWTAA